MGDEEIYVLVEWKGRENEEDSMDILPLSTSGIPLNEEELQVNIVTKAKHSKKGAKGKYYEATVLGFSRQSYLMEQKRDHLVSEKKEILNKEGKLKENCESNKPKRIPQKSSKYDSFIAINSTQEFEEILDESEKYPTVTYARGTKWKHKRQLNDYEDKVDDNMARQVNIFESNPISNAVSVLFDLDNQNEVNDDNASNSNTIGSLNCDTNNNLSESTIAGAKEHLDEHKNDNQLEDLEKVSSHHHVSLSEGTGEDGNKETNDENRLENAVDESHERRETTKDDNPNHALADKNEDANGSMMLGDAKIERDVLQLHSQIFAALAHCNSTTDIKKVLLDIGNSITDGNSSAADNESNKSLLLLKPKKMVELVAGSGLLVPKVDKAGLILIARGDPVKLAKGALDLLYEDRLASMSAKGRRQNGAVGEKTLRMILYFANSNKTEKALELNEDELVTITNEHCRAVRRKMKRKLEGDKEDSENAPKKQKVPRTGGESKTNRVRKEKEKERRRMRKEALHKES